MNQKAVKHLTYFEERKANTQNTNTLAEKLVFSPENNSNEDITIDILGKSINVSDIVRDISNPLNNTITTSLKMAENKITEFNETVNDIQTNIQNMIDKIDSTIENTKQQINDFMVNIWDNIKNLINKVDKFIIDTKKQIEEFLQRVVWDNLTWQNKPSLR